jgi:predicted NUDIX family NTP pyrophosphohydrolase/predicted alpha/beta-hydrolase family hydrolase
METGAESMTLQIPAGEVTLTGDLEIPENSRGLVLFAHGSGSSRRSPRNQAVAEVLRDAGMATLLFDLLTPHEEVEDAYSGHLRFDIGLLSRRLAIVTKEIADDPRSRNLGLGYFGASTGGAAALRAAAALGSTIGAVVSRGGRPDLAGKALAHVKAPTLLIVGERDEEVLRLNEGAYAQLQCEKSLAVVPRATHLFQEPGALEEVARLAADWFRKHLSNHVDSVRARSTISAGLLMFRRKGSALEVLLVHPGGPFFVKKDEGAWTIPKGEAAPGEDLLQRAQIEFEEELGIRPRGNWIELGSIKQKGGKTVHAWAFEGDLPDSFKLKSNTFEMEWPPDSGKLKKFPEIDRAEFFAEEVARRKINRAQVVLLDRLCTRLGHSLAR